MTVHHQLETMQHGTEFGLKRFVAHCSCGWQSPVCYPEDIAKDCLVEHMYSVVGVADQPGPDERTTAELCKELGFWFGDSPTARAAAVRLMKLEDDLHQQERDTEVFALQLSRIDALRPPCPTCGGKGYVTAWFDVPYPHHKPCPANCVDGKVSIEQLVATHNAVWQEWPEEHLPTSIIGLRAVRPTDGDGADMSEVGE